MQSRLKYLRLEFFWPVKERSGEIIGSIRMATVLASFKVTTQYGNEGRVVYEAIAESI